MIELVTVVLIIGIIAVIATPTMASQIRERRSRQVAQEVAQLFSNARMRAMGRGAAVMVRYNSSSGFQVVESIEGTLAGVRGALACRTLPGRGCLATNWGSWTVPVDAQIVTTLNPSAADSELSLAMRAPDAAALLSDASVCFSPLGRSFASYTTLPPTTPMAGAATIEVKRGTYGLARTVAVLPNGSARLAL